MRPGLVDQPAAGFAVCLDFFFELRQPLHGVWWEAGDFGNRFQFAAAILDLLPMWPDMLDHPMTGHLPLGIGLFLVEFRDAVLDPSAFGAKLLVLFTERLPGCDVLGQDLFTFQQVNQASRASVGVEQVRFSWSRMEPASRSLRPVGPSVIP